MKINLIFHNRPKNDNIRYFQNWEVAEDIVVDLESWGIHYSQFIIPKGFKTDLSSVPRVLWGIMPPFGNFLIAALVHDYMYHINFMEDMIGTKTARKIADKAMLALSMKYNGDTLLHRIDNHLRYYAVRLFGTKIYKK